MSETHAFSDRKDFLKLMPEDWQIKFKKGLRLTRSEDAKPLKSPF